MSRARLNIFLERDHARRLDELAAMKGLSKSSIIAAALSSFLSPDSGDQREAAIGKRLERGEQSLVFLNRRGYAPVLACPVCGWVSHCRRCAAKLQSRSAGSSR